MADTTTPVLRVNGIAIPCTDGPKLSGDEFAATTDRSAMGAMWGTRRGFKRSITAKTIPYAWDDAESIRGLVEGKGVTLAFDNSSFLANGWAAPVTTGAAAAITANTAAYVYPPASLALAANASPPGLQWTLPGMLSGPLGVTINVWVINPGDGYHSWVTLHNATASDGGIYVGKTGQSPSGFVMNYPNVNSTNGGLQPTWGTDWHMLTVVIRDTTVSTYPAGCLYFDGVRRGTINAANTPFLLNDRAILQLGPCTSSVGSNMDEVAVYPFPLNDAQVASLFVAQTRNAATSLGASSPTPWSLQQAGVPPRVWVSGDGISDPFYAIGRVVGTSVLAAFRAPVTQAFANNGRVLDLQFMEV